MARDHQRRVVYLPEPEGPARLVKQFLELAREIAAINGRPEAGSCEVQIASRVALDSIPLVEA